MEQIQKAHYDKIAAEYEAHYDDPCSWAYREQFFHRPMFAGIELSGLQVLEAMCGSGSTTKRLLAEGALITGLDISPESIKSFLKRWPDCRAVCASLVESGLPSESFDCVAIIGGLHHLHPQLEPAVREIHRILKPGGQLCFAEPHRDSFPDLIRRRWYKRDPLFASNEEAIDLDKLKKTFAGDFHFKREIYQGNLAYLFVLNSMVLRIPAFLKPLYTPLMIKLEKLLNPLQGRRTSCFVVCQWQRK